MAKNWSKSALMCYKRNGNCKGCFYEDFFEDYSCQMITTVSELVAKFGTPTEVDFKRFGEDEL